MLIDGNHDRGVDVAISTDQAWPRSTMRSHVDDTGIPRGISSSRIPGYAAARSEVTVTRPHAYEGC